MTAPDSAWNALTAAVSSSESPLAANLAEILADTIRGLTEAQPSARIGAEPNDGRCRGRTGATVTATRSCRPRSVISAPGS